MERRVGRRVLVVGGGGREHALAWRLAASPSVDAVVTAPGNPGTATVGENLDVDPTDADAVAKVAEKARADLVVVGPEAPLVAGVVDSLNARDVPAFGPTAAAARLEGSKSFAKDVMAAAGAPTAAHSSHTEPATAKEALRALHPPFVVKADGLAAGKGVRICGDLAEADAAVDDMLTGRAFGDASATIVIEEYLDGPEMSVFGVCDGTDVVLLAPSQDHKRALDGDRGPNTGGMGAYLPLPGFPTSRAGELRDTVFTPVLRELADRGTPFRGLMYAGLVLTAHGPRLLEFNARFGDPETQVVLPALASDLGDLLWASAVGEPGRDGVASVDVAWHDGGVVTVVLASGGYPGTYATGLPISGVDVANALEGVTVFHAGTAVHDGQLVTAGGRVLAVTARGADLREARSRAYDAVDHVAFDGMHRRTDIAARPLA